jgi:hypothetical protein
MPVSFNLKSDLSSYPNPGPALPPPRSGWACDDREKRDQGRALFERNAVKRVCADPRFSRAAQVARSEAQEPRQPGRLSLLTFFGEAKKASRPPGETGQQNQAKKTKP